MKQYDLLKKNLRGYKVEVDKEKLWQQTVHAIPQKKKRRPIVIPFLFGALLLSGGFTYYYFIGSNQLEKNHPSKFTLSSAENTSLASNQIDYSITNKQKEKTNINYKENLEQSENSHSQVNPRNFSSRDKLSEGNSSSDSPNKAQTFQSSPGNHEQNEKTIKSESNHSLQLNSDPPTFTNEVSRVEVDTKSAILTSPESLQWSTTPIDALPLSSLANKHDPEIKSINNSIITPGSPYKNVFSMAILQGLGFSNLSYDAGNPQAEAMQDFLSQATRSLESVSTTVRGNIQFTKGFMVSAGFAFRRLITETIYQNTITERMEQEGTSTIIIDELGQQHLVSGNIGTTHLLETEHTRYSTHQKVDIELALHKRIFGFRRTTVNGYLKAGVNVHYAVEGSAFTSEYELVRFQDMDNPYSLSSPLTFGGGLDVEYRLSPRWLLLGTAGIDQLKIHHQDYNQLQWRHTIYSLSLGVGYVL